MAILNQDKRKSEDEFSGGGRPAPGSYHVAVNNCEMTASRQKGTPGLQVEFQVICEGLGTDRKSHTKDQAGKTIGAFLAMVSDKGEKETNTLLNQIACFAMATGLLGPEETKDTDEIEWDAAIGRELVLIVEAGKYTDKGGNERESSQVAFMGFRSLGNPKVKDVPKDLKSPGMQAMGRGITTSHPGGAPKASDGHTGGTAGGNGNAGNGHANGSQATAAAGSASKSRYADL